MTKEELLQKGLTEEDADEIISAFSDDESQEDLSLQALQKALDDDPEMDSLFKAEKKGDDDDDDSGDDYDEKFMKKMNRYMKKNGKVFEKMDDSKKDMKKAIDEIDLDSEGGVVEMEDLAPFLKDQSAFNENMSKAVEVLAASIEMISAKTEKSYDLMQKAAKVQVETAKGMDEFLSTPTGRKGVVADKDMQKAQKTSNEQSAMVYEVLLKATQDKDRKAGQIISAFESSGRNINSLKPEHRKYVNTLLKKGAN